MESQRVGHNWACTYTHIRTLIYWACIRMHVEKISKSLSLNELLKTETDWLKDSFAAKVRDSWKGLPAAAAAAVAKSRQLCPTLCNPIDSSPPGSPIPGILQARTLEWVAISFSDTWKWKVKEKSLSRVRLFVTPWTASYQAPPSMGFSRQEYWNGVPLPSPKGLPSPFKL